MATRTAPTVGALTATSHLSTIHLIDASGDLWAEAITTLDVPVLADVETWVAAYQAATQASVWKVTAQSIFEGDRDADNADVGQRNSIKDGVNTLYKNVATLDTQTPRLIAPIAAVMQGNQDIPLLTAAQFSALIAATLTLLGAGYALRSAQFTERKERTNNPRISA